LGGRTIRLKKGFAPIVPLKYLEDLAGLSNFQMCIAHWCVEEDYLNFYRERFSAGDFTILDNGACELDVSIEVSELLDVYIELGGADIVVVPDTKEGGTGNIELYNKFMEEGWRSKFLHAIEGVTPYFMVVPHSLEEFRYFNEFTIADYIGLNQGMEQHGRLRLIRDAVSKGTSKSFHLLGMMRNPLKEIMGANELGDYILGMDSSLPYRITKLGRKLNEYKPFPALINMYEEELEPSILKHCIGEFEGLIERSLG